MSVALRPEATFDFRAPDYVAVFKARAERLAWLRSGTPEERAQRVAGLKLYYRDHIGQFINDWGMTFEVRNPEVGLPAAIPFILFPKQEAWIEETLWLWKNRKNGITEKSRDCGITWLAIATSCALCLFYDGINIGFGSRKQEYVDAIDAPKAIFVRVRQFLRHLPEEFRGGWTEKNSPFMRTIFPESGSTISGEAGDNIGRGDRAAIYFVDESAHLEHPTLVEASLSQTTNCRIDISSANGMGNPFAQKRHSGKFRVFTFHWRDDPRKDQAWYDGLDLDPVTLAQEVDINYTASVEGVLIPSAWVQAAIDAHIYLGIEPTGERRGAFDVADEGVDKCAFGSAKGILVDFLDEWSGQGSDPFQSVVIAHGHADALDIRSYRYDADGMGALVRGDARVLNEAREADGRPPIGVEAFRGSGAVFRPEAEDVKGRQNKDYFMNCKAQSWGALSRRFRNTYRARMLGAEYDPAEIISLCSKMPLLTKLCSELSQPTWKPNSIGKMVVDKAPDGVLSPNLADDVMMLFSEVRGTPMVISDEALNGI